MLLSLKKAMTGFIALRSKVYSVKEGCDKAGQRRIVTSICLIFQNTKIIFHIES